MKKTKIFEWIGFIITLPSVLALRFFMDKESDDINWLTISVVGICLGFVISLTSLILRKIRNKKRKFR